MTSCLTVEGRGFNGWPNYETWIVALWLDNEEWSYRHWRATVHAIRLEAPISDYVLKSSMSVEDATGFLLADELRGSVEAYMPDWGTTMYTDLLNNALQSVEWLDIAKHMLSEET